MDQNNFCVVGHLTQSTRNRILPRISPLDHAHRLLEFFPLDLFLEPRYFIRPRRHDNVCHLRASRNPPQAEDHDGRPIQLEKLLGRLRAHARSESSGRQNGSDSTHIGSGTADKGPEGGFARV